MSRKLQVSIEFLIIFSFVLAVTLYILIISNERATDFFVSEQDLNAKQITDRISSSINQVFLGGVGSKKTIYIPDGLIGNTTYNATVYSDARVVVLDWGLGSNHISPIITAVNESVVRLYPGELNISYSKDWGIVFEQ
jgi:hypothetical protein